MLFLPDSPLPLLLLLLPQADLARALKSLDTSLLRQHDQDPGRGEGGGQEGEGGGVLGRQQQQQLAQLRALVADIALSDTAPDLLGAKAASEVKEAS